MSIMPTFITGLFKRFTAPKDRRATPENPTFDLNSPAAWDAFGAEKSTTGISISTSKALTVSAFWRAVNIISADVGKLPLSVYKREGEGWTEDREHPAYRLLKRKPNPYMTAYAWRQTKQGHACTKGNSYSYIFRTSNADPIDLLLLSVESTYPVRMNGELWYLTTLPNGEQRKLRAEDVIHIKGLGDDGLIGYSLIQKARNSMGLSIATEEYGARFFQNNAEPRIVLEHPGKIGETAAQNLVKSWNAMHAGLENAHKTAVLEEGMKANKISISAKDSQLLESRQFQVREIANWTGVPAYLLGDSQQNAYASLEQRSQDYLDKGLDPWLVMWEQELEDKLLTEEQKKSGSHQIKFNRRALVRADMQQRFNAYASGLTNGWLNRNEVRAAEDMNPIEGGDVFLQQLNMTPANGATEEPPKPTKKPEPPPVDDGEDDAARAALRIMAEDAGRRMIHRLALAANRAAKSPGTFEAAMQKMKTEHSRTIAETFEPILTAASKLGATKSGEDSVAFVVESVRNAMNARYNNSKRSTLADDISTDMEQIEKTQPAAFAEWLIGKGFKNDD